MFIFLCPSKSCPHFTKSGSERIREWLLSLVMLRKSLTFSGELSLDFISLQACSVGLFGYRLLVHFVLE